MAVAEKLLHLLSKRCSLLYNPTRSVRDFYRIKTGLKKETVDFPMDHRCLPTKRHFLEPPGVGAGLRLSSGQIGLLRKLARDSRTGFMVPLHQRKQGLPHGRLAVFSGPKGSGKRMAADIVSRELGFAIYRIDLSQVVSPYIGETEKNLAKLLTTAEAKKSILLFDEADALFGQRTDVKDRHDRYANIEVSYLLDRLRAYPGLVVIMAHRKVELDPQSACLVDYHLEFSPPSSPSSYQR